MSTMPLQSAATEKQVSAGGRETFGYMKRKYVFDITRAIEIASDGREPVELDDDDVRFSLDKVRINKKHLEHVDVSRPGIVAIVHAFGEDGALVKGHRMIDGHHRAARCLELGLPFSVYLLNERESIQILERSPCKSLLDAEFMEVP